uniref:AlNc14C152G7553 protein n=1 Tax=Albugo laibachii Nc14 TaxID=890382 RepID=F0WM42_9STRA|nr:AlNc14C152G7553 [Albugo laibachii Nc14]|eukprot:CCA22370.1 AlNc14C152G7553 [Albugo laibachii Nc14]
MSLEVDTWDAWYWEYTVCGDCWMIMCIECTVTATVKRHVYNQKLLLTTFNTFDSHSTLLLTLVQTLLFANKANISIRFCAIFIEVQNFAEQGGVNVPLLKGSMEDNLQKITLESHCLSTTRAFSMTDRFCWSCLAGKYEGMLVLDKFEFTSDSNKRLLMYLFTKESDFLPDGTVCSNECDKIQISYDCTLGDVHVNNLTPLQDVFGWIERKRVANKEKHMSNGSGCFLVEHSSNITFLVSLSTNLEVSSNPGCPFEPNCGCVEMDLMPAIMCDLESERIKQNIDLNSIPNDDVPLLAVGGLKEDRAVHVASVVLVKWNSNNLASAEEAAACKDCFICLSTKRRVVFISVEKRYLWMVESEIIFANCQECSGKLSVAQQFPYNQNLRQISARDASKFFGNLKKRDAQIVGVLAGRNHMDAPCVHVLEVSKRAWVECLVQIDCVLCRELTTSFYLNVERRRALGEDFHSVENAGEAFANKHFFSVVDQLTPLDHLAGEVDQLTTYILLDGHEAIKQWFAASSHESAIDRIDILGGHRTKTSTWTITIGEECQDISRNDKEKGEFKKKQAKIKILAKAKPKCIMFRSMFGAKIVSVQISEAVFIQQVGKDRKWYGRWDTVISETEGKVRVTCGILPENGGKTEDCAYDKEAFKLYKQVMKAVRRFFSIDILKYEDFKINSRLVGNNFMEAHEYVDYLAKSLGGLRMLLLLPCLVKIQPDPVKRNLLLSAARTYRTRNLTDLKQRCDAESQSKKQAQTPVKQKQYVQNSFDSKDGDNEQAQTTPMDRTLHLTHSYETNASNKPVEEHVVSQQKLEMKEDSIQRHAELETIPISISKHETQIQTLDDREIALTMASNDEALVQGFLTVEIKDNKEVIEPENGKYHTEYTLHNTWIQQNGHRVDWEVSRRYREFCAIDILLREKHPSHAPVFPILPSKTLFGSSLSTELIDKRQRDLGIYIVSMLKSTPLLVQDEIIDSFLEIRRNILQDARQWQLKKSTETSLTEVKPGLFGVQ